MAQRQAAVVGATGIGIGVNLDVAGKGATIPTIQATLPNAGPQATVSQQATRAAQSSLLTKHQKRALTAIREERIEEEALALRAALAKGVSRDLLALEISVELELKRTAVFDQRFLQDVDSKYVKKGKAIDDERKSKLGKIEKELEPRRKELQAEVTFLTAVLEETRQAEERGKKGLRTKTPNASKYFDTIKPKKIFGAIGTDSNGEYFDFSVVASHAQSALDQASKELAELKAKKRERNGKAHSAFLEASSKLTDRRRDEISVGRGGMVLLDFLRDEGSTTAPGQVPVLLTGAVQSVINLRKKRDEREEMAARILIERKAVINKAFASSVDELRERNGERPAIPSNGHAQRECEEVFFKWLDYHTTHKNGAKTAEPQNAAIPKAAS